MSFWRKYTCTHVKSTIGAYPWYARKRGFNASNSLQSLLTELKMIGQLMGLPNNKQQLFDLWAPLYDFLFPSVFYQAIHKRMLEYVQLPSCPNVLDIGCGTGRLLDRLATEHSDLQGTGLDFSAEMLRQARRSNHHRPRLIFVQGSAAPLPFADEQFNVVFNTLSFLHYLEPERVFAEINRVLRPGGTFYLVDPTIITPIGICRLPVSPNGIKLYSPKVREQMGAHAGFRCLKHQYLLGPNLLTIFRRRHCKSNTGEWDKNCPDDRRHPQT